MLLRMLKTEIAAVGFMFWPGAFARRADCPGGVAPRRVHSRYERKLAETGSGGQEVLIHLQTRRFFCGNDACAKGHSASKCRA
jgi:hypothetical protein